MKLVDIDDLPHQTGDQSYLSLPSDEKFTAPRILSMLDNSMNAILNRNDMNDGEKWTLYNQTLQRYLNHMRKTQKSNTQQLPHNIQFNEEEQQNHTSEAFNNRISDHDITGIFPIRDSIETITQPNVRQFFQQARQSDVNQLSPIHHMSVDNNSMINFNRSPETPPQHQQQPIPILGTKRTGEIIPKRARKRGPSRDVTGIHPYKVVSRPGNTPPRAPQRSTAKSQLDFYWKSTKAK